MSQAVCVLRQQVGVRVVDRHPGRLRLEGCLASVVQQLTSLGEGQTAGLVADAEEHLVPDARVDRRPREDVEDQELVRLAPAVHAREQRRLRLDCRFGEGERGLYEVVAVSEQVPGALDGAVVQPDDDGPAVGVREADQGLGELPRLDPDRFPVEPLVLDDGDQELTDVSRVGGQRPRHLVAPHASTLNMLE